MGSLFGGRVCSSSPYATPNSNPSPDRYNIKDSKVIGRCLILEVNYPDATNFEGNKIMVYKGFSSCGELLKACSGKLDPHFSKSNVSPIARFAPTDEGRRLAEYVARNA